MPRRVSGMSVSENAIEWSDWNDQFNGDCPGVRWGKMFDSDHVPGVGIFEIAPEHELPKHHHEPEELYFVLSGAGSVKVYQKEHTLEPGTCVHIPSEASHVTRNTGSEPLRVLYTFPKSAFSDVEYQID